MSLPKVHGRCAPGSVCGSLSCCLVRAPLAALAALLSYPRVTEAPRVQRGAECTYSLSRDQTGGPCLHVFIWNFFNAVRWPRG